VSPNAPVTPIVVVDGGGDIARPYWVRYESMPVDGKGQVYPIFSRTETAKCFFGWKSFWLKHRLNELTDEQGLIPLDGGTMGPLALDGHGSPVFSLADVERVAHALAQAGMISGIHLQRTVAIVRSVAYQYGVPL
jgi:hypothetical protein